MSQQGLCHTSSSVPHWFLRYSCLLKKKKKKGLDTGLLSACWGGSEQDQNVGIFVYLARQRWLSVRRSGLCLKRDGFEFVFSVKNAHLIASREVLGQIAKGMLNSSALLFIHKQTKLWLCYLIQPSLSCCVYWGLCYKCVQFVRWWQRHGLWSMQGLFVVSFLISLMISSNINFNKFLRICWCMLILAWGDGGFKPSSAECCQSPVCAALTGEICRSVTELQVSI